MRLTKEQVAAEMRKETKDQHPSTLASLLFHALEYGKTIPAAPPLPGERVLSEEEVSAAWSGAQQAIDRLGIDPDTGLVPPRGE